MPKCMWCVYQVSLLCLPLMSWLSGTACVHLLNQYLIPDVISLSKWSKLPFTISLWMPLLEASRIEEANNLRHLQNNLYDALYHHIFKDYPGDSRRMCRLLTVLPLLRQLAIESVEHVSRYSEERSVPIQQLFKEMLQCTTHSQATSSLSQNLSQDWSTNRL